MIYADPTTASGPLAAGAPIYLGTILTIEESIVAGAAHSTITVADMTSIPGINTNVDTDLQLSLAAGTVYLRVGINSIMPNDQEAILNRSWLHPYAQGGLRNGDTIWANMTYNNPHATEGLFAKSRGVLNEAFVCNLFNGGEGS